MTSVNIVAYSISSLTETSDRVLSFSQGRELYAMAPVAFPANGAIIGTRVGSELTTPALSTQVKK